MCANRVQGAGHVVTGKESFCGRWAKAVKSQVSSPLCGCWFHLADPDPVAYGDAPLSWETSRCMQGLVPAEIQNATFPGRVGQERI